MNKIPSLLFVVLIRTVLLVVLAFNLSNNLTRNYYLTNQLR